MRRLLPMLGMLLASLVAAVSASAAPVFVVTGRGWGHGIGMSQYGAHGFASHGWTHEAILEHYYRGADLTRGATSDSVRVLLASGRASLSLSSAESFTGGGRSFAAGTYTLTPVPGAVALRRDGTSATVPGPATLMPGGAALVLDGIAYRGTLTIASSAGGDALSAVNELGREAYLQGVVPREMPAGWPAEALRAQAVAARTYSLAVTGHCLASAAPVAGDPVLCADTRDQVYGGRSAETAATNASVQATAGEILTFGGRPLTAYFFSSSGGRTATKAEEWGPPDVPYLVSVDDPYDDVSPHHAWGGGDTETDCPMTSPDCTFTALQVKELLGLVEPPLDLRVRARNGSGRVTSLEATGAKTAIRLAGTSARTMLGLRSTWFRVGVLSLQPSAPRITYGQRVTLSGLARGGGTSGWGGARLERRRAGATAWTPSSARLPDGAWTADRRPSRTTGYRVVSSSATGEAERVSVRTSVTVRAPAPPFTRVRGTVRPARRGVVATLERRRADGSWAVSARVRTDATGRFRFTVSRRGTYRVRADAGPGLLAGSASITLPARASGSARRAGRARAGAW